MLRYQVLFCFDIQLCALNDGSGSLTIVSCSTAMFSHEIYSGVKVFFQVECLFGTIINMEA